MRKLILRMQISIDGFVCGPNGELDWIFPSYDDASTAWAVERLWDAGAHLMGRVTYGDMAAHWPTSTEFFAPPMNDIPKVVFSKTLKEAAWGPLRILSGDLATEIEKLKREDGKELLAHGGASFARSLVETGLIDEYRLFVHPIALGEGKALFSGLAAPLRLAQVETKTFPTGLIARTLRPKS